MKVVVGGQISKQEIADYTKKFMGDAVQVDVMDDLEAAMALKDGRYDYYLGACNTGGGGALAMAMAIAGADLCATVSMPGNICSDEVITAEVQKGKKAFGFTAQHIEQVLPVLLKAIIDQN